MITKRNKSMDSRNESMFLQISYTNPASLKILHHTLNLIVFRTWSITDVFGLDDELLAMVPTPVTSLLLLFPLTNKVVDLLKEKDKSIEQPQEVKNS